MNEDFNIPLSLIPNEKYRKFFEKFKEIDTLNAADWKVVHLLAYFCRKYKAQYNMDYAFKFNTPSPVKCFEVWQINSLAAKLSSKPHILKNYIDWCFENVVPKAKKRLYSLSFLNKEETLTHYKLNVLLIGQTSNNTIDRSTVLSDKYKDILHSTSNLLLSTYGDLAFIFKMDPLPANFEQALKKMEELGFNREVLERIV